MVDKSQRPQHVYNVQLLYELLPSLVIEFVTFTLLKAANQAQPGQTCLHVLFERALTTRPTFEGPFMGAGVVLGAWSVRMID